MRAEVYRKETKPKHARAVISLNPHGVVTTISNSVLPKFYGTVNYCITHFTGTMDLEAKNTTEWYKGRSVFITGATGFMGKVLMEKLLYSYPDIKTIYILIRSKRGRTAEQRIDDMWKLPVITFLLELFRLTTDQTPRNYDALCK